MQYGSLTDVREANHRAGETFFEPTTLAYFHGGIDPQEELFWGRWFITYEQFQGSTETDPVRWTIREVDSQGCIQTAAGSAGFLGYETREDAVDAITELHNLDQQATIALRDDAP